MNPDESSLNPIASNRYTLTQELFYEVAKRLSRETYRGFAIKIVIAVSVAWALLAGATLFFAPSYWLLILETFVSAMIIFWVAVYTPWNQRRRAFQQLKDRYGENIVRSIDFYTHKLTVYAGGRKLTANYTDVQKIIRSEHFTILMLENGTNIMINQEGFLTGSLDDVLACIPQKA